MPVIKKDDKFNMLTAIKFIHRNNHGSQYWLFKCECGNKKVILVKSVKRNLTKSCGCLLKRGGNFKHGMSKLNIYAIWREMKYRCLNLNHPKYKNYGGRGIKICDRWLKFENFYKDMGDKIEGKSIDRINNNGNYCKENCKWSTPKEQMNNVRYNRFLTYNNKTQTMAQWAEELNIKYDTIKTRINRGWNIKKVLRNLD